jgi:hypothetical protein
MGTLVVNSIKYQKVMLEGRLRKLTIPIENTNSGFNCMLMKREIAPMDSEC